VGYGFYPGTGSRKDAKGREDRLVNVPFREGEGSSEKFRRAWAEEIFPKLRKFQPELIILSMGFDAVAEDPLGEMELRPEDFEWLSREVRRVGGRKGGREGGREGCKVVSILEGGYDLAALGACAIAHVRGLLGATRAGEGEEGEGEGEGEREWEEEQEGEGGGEGEEGPKAHVLPPVTMRDEEELVEGLKEVRVEDEGEEGRKGGREGGIRRVRLGGVCRGGDQGGTR
jgi:hypothetical protein